MDSCLDAWNTPCSVGRGSQEAMNNEPSTMNKKVSVLH